MQWRNAMVVLVLVLLGGCKEEKLAQGKTAPALAAFDLQGKEASLDRWRGKSIYLNFWSADCGGCLAEMDTLEALSEQWGDKVTVVAVNTDPGSGAAYGASGQTRHHLSGAARPAQDYSRALSGDRHTHLGTDRQPGSRARHASRGAQAARVTANLYPPGPPVNHGGFLASNVKPVCSGVKAYFDRCVMAHPDSNINGE